LGTPCTELSELTPALLFENRRAVRTSDVACARADIEQVFFRHSLSRARGDHDLQFCHRGARLWRTSFNYIGYGSDVQVAVDYTDRDLFVAVVPLGGEAEVEYLGHRTLIRRGQYVVLDPMATFRFHMSPDHCHLAIGVPAATFRASTGAGSSPRARELHAWASGPRAIVDSDSGLFEYIAYLCQQLDRSATQLRDSTVARSLEESFLTMLFASLRRDADCGARVAGSLPPGVVPAHVKRAEAYMLSHIMDDIRLEDIVAAADVPVRTLYNGFQRYRGIGPMQWLRVQRLERARSDLADSRDTAPTVTDIANRYCASNIGRFARAYLAHFGELPSETLRRARSLKV
jgi:AraC-like DNA-binding protein